MNRRPAGLMVGVFAIYSTLFDDQPLPLSIGVYPPSMFIATRFPRVLKK